MQNKRLPLIAGNWKMNLDHLQAIANVQKLAWSLEDSDHDYKKTEVAVFPPFTDLRSIQILLEAEKLKINLGAQDVSEHEEGAFTGDIAARLLAKMDVKYVLVGHSERRQGHNETDQVVANKAKSAMDQGLVPIICVGESAEDLEKYGPAVSAVEQVKAAIGSLPQGKEFVIAYEPVWAIGTGKAATAEQAGSVAREIRGAVEKELDASVAENTRILYGGSVTSSNVAQFMRETHIDGVLVGGASLKPTEFSKIALYRKHVTA